MLHKLLVLSLFSFLALKSTSQEKIIKFTDQFQSAVPYLTVLVNTQAFVTDATGHIVLKAKGSSAHINLKATQYEHLDSVFPLSNDTLYIKIFKKTIALNEVVISIFGKEQYVSSQITPVSSISSQYLQKGGALNLNDGIGLITGIKAQQTCNVCGSSEIRINGMEGAYTLVMIDGMPMVTGLGTVYGLTGIPNNLIERVEIVKGPSGALFGSDAMAGTLNIVTQKALAKPRATFGFWGSTYSEWNANMGITGALGKHWKGLFSAQSTVNNAVIDNNYDGFTDGVLQKSVSLFGKISHNGKSNFQLALRGYHDNRWGGQLNWTPAFRGTDSVYGESIWVQHYELLASFNSGKKNLLKHQLSGIYHHQNAYYGTQLYVGTQNNVFYQNTLPFQIKKSQLILGSTLRYNGYDDNSPVTATGTVHHVMPGFFTQLETNVQKKWAFQPGFRLDYERTHGFIPSPRLAIKFSPSAHQSFRMAIGSGFRIVNVFSEDHAALTGSRTVVFTEKLLPERSWNGLLHWVTDIHGKFGSWSIESNLFYNYFTNKIVPNYDLNPEWVVYSNLNGHLINKGGSIQINSLATKKSNFSAGFTYMHSKRYEVLENTTIKQDVPFVPKWNGNITYAYTFKNSITLDLSGIVTGTMHMPVFEQDPRSNKSPVWANINLGAKYKIKKLQFIATLKNVFNYIPQGILLRPFDPFDKQINNPQTNPFNHTFDASYNYAPLLGRRLQLGILLNI